MNLRWRKSPSWFACGGCCRERVDDSGGDMPAQSFSGERQCAYTAFSGDEFEEDTLPVRAMSARFRSI